MTINKHDDLSCDELFDEAERLMKIEDYKSALVIYDRIEKLDGLQGPTMGKVQALWALGYFKEAARSYKKFIRQNPWDDMVYVFANFVIKLGLQKPMHFYSCFISYATEDQGFADDLYRKLQRAGINCWKWDHDAKTGHDLWAEIDDAIICACRLGFCAFG